MFSDVAISATYGYGVVSLSFMTNIEVQAVIPEEYSSWISVEQTRNLNFDYVTLNVAANESDERRDAIVKVQSMDGALAVEYTILQAGIATPSNPGVDEDGTILGKPRSNEIFYTSTHGGVVEPSDPYIFGALIVSNTYSNGVGVIVFDRDITTIGSCAFSDNDYLRAISIPDSITQIGYSAFSYCSNLELINFPESLTSIDSYAFSNCKSFVSIDLPDSLTTIEYAAFEHCYSLVSIDLPDSLLSIGDWLFSACSNLVSVNLPNSLEVISGGTFNACENLSSIALPESLREIHSEAFKGCSSLISVEIPDSVTRIDDSVFFQCVSLTEVVIGKGVTYIGDEAFRHCLMLDNIYCKPTTPPEGREYMFDQIGPKAAIYVPEGSKDSYKEADYWNNYSEIIADYNFAE